MLPPAPLRAPTLGIRFIAGIAVALSVYPLAGQAQPGLPQLPTFENRPIVLTSAEVAALARGEPAVRLLETRDPRVVAVFGIVAVGVSRTFFQSRAADFSQSLRSAGRTQFELFGTPATAADAAALVVSPSDLASLRSCRPGACEFKLPSAEMSRLHSILDNFGTAGAAEITRYLRRRASEYVNTYRERGDAAMISYDDYGRVPVRASEAFAGLFGATSFLAQNAPALQQSLSSSPHRRPEGATEGIYWSRDETPGMRPTVSVSQITVYSPPEHPHLTVVTTKQLFADHYFESAYDLLVATSRPDVPRAEGIYLWLLRQDRFDHLPSGGLLNIRGRVNGKLRERTDAELRRIRLEFQAAWARRRPER